MYNGIQGRLLLMVRPGRSLTDRPGREYLPAVRSVLEQSGPVRCTRSAGAFVFRDPVDVRGRHGLRPRQKSIEALIVPPRRFAGASHWTCELVLLPPLLPSAFAGATADRSQRASAKAD